MQVGSAAPEMHYWSGGNSAFDLRARLGGAAHILRTPHVSLLLSAALTGLVYGWGFLRPAFLLTIDIPALAGEDYLYLHRPAAQIRLVAGFILLSLFYLYGLWAAARVDDRRAWALVAGAGALFAGLLLFMYPFGAADIFDNIIHGRILSEYGGNPFLQVATMYREDPFFPYVAWIHQTSAYGPVWELMAGAIAGIIGTGFIPNVVAFKLLPGIFWLASGLILVRLLRDRAPKYALSGALLWFWNPALLYETWGNGHNDAVIVALMLAAVWLLLEERHSLAFLSLTVGALVKYIPVLLMPAAAFVALRRPGNMRKRLSYLAITGSSALALTALAYWPFWTGWQTLTVSRRLGMYTTSLPAMAMQLALPMAGEAEAKRWIGLSAGILTAAAALWLGWRGSRGRDWFTFPETAFGILAFYLLVTCLWFQGWYVMWLIGFGALIPSRRLRSFAIFFSLVVMAKYFLLGPILLWRVPWPPQPLLEVTFTLGVMGLPWLAAALTALRGTQERCPYERGRS